MHHTMCVLDLAGDRGTDHGKLMAWLKEQAPTTSKSKVFYDTQNSLRFGSRAAAGILIAES